MNLEAIRLNCAMEQKRGLHFILTSVIIWCAITIIHMTDMPISSKNLFTFCSTTTLLPVSFMISKIIRVRFSNKDNPLNNLGFILSMNQMLYLLIAMWVYAAVPEKLVMVLAMIFGAHLFPFGWLYKSMSYKVAAIMIPIFSLVVGNTYETYKLGVMMIIIEVVFSIVLIIEVKKEHGVNSRLE